MTKERIYISLIYPITLSTLAKAQHPEMCLGKTNAGMYLCYFNRASDFQCVLTRQSFSLSPKEHICSNSKRQE